MLNFEGADPSEDRGVFNPNSLLKTDSHPSSFLRCKQSCIRRRADTGCGGTASRGTKAPPSSLEVTAPVSVLEEAVRGNGGLMRKSIYKYSRTCKYKNLTAPAFGIEQKVLVPNELRKFTVS